MRYYIYISLIAVLSVFCFNNAMGQGVSVIGNNNVSGKTLVKSDFAIAKLSNTDSGIVYIGPDSIVRILPLSYVKGGGGSSGSVDSVTISNDSLFYWGGGVSFFVGIVNSGGSIDTTGLSGRINYNLTRIDGLSDSVGANRDSINVQRTAIDGKEPSITPGTTDQYWQGDKTWQAKSGLPISTATQAALDGKISYSDTTTIIASQDYVNSAIADIPADTVPSWQAVLDAGNTGDSVVVSNKLFVGTTEDYKPISIQVIGDSRDAAVFGGIAPLKIWPQRVANLMGANLNQALAQPSTFFMNEEPRFNPLDDTSAVMDVILTGKIKNVTGLSDSDYYLFVTRCINDLHWYTTEDSGYNYTPENFGRDYRIFMDSVVGWGYDMDKTVLMGPKYVLPNSTMVVQDSVFRWIDTVRQIATDYGCKFFDAFHWEQGRGGATLLDIDNFHENETGHAVLTKGMIVTIDAPVKRNGQNLAVNGIFETNRMIFRGGNDSSTQNSFVMMVNANGEVYTSGNKVIWNNSPDSLRQEADINVSKIKGRSLEATGLNSVSLKVGNNTAIQGGAASNGVVYFDASANTTGTVNIRAGSTTTFNSTEISSTVPFRSSLMWVGTAVQGNSASNGTLYVDASKNTTGTVNIRAGATYTFNSSGFSTSVGLAALKARFTDTLTSSGNVYFAGLPKAATKDSVVGWESGRLFAIPKPAGGSADSSTFAPNYRLDTAKAKLRTEIAAKEPIITAGTTDDYWQGDKTWQPKSGLPISTATQTALDGKIPYTDTSSYLPTKDFLANNYFVQGGNQFPDTFQMGNYAWYQLWKGRSSGQMSILNGAGNGWYFEIVQNANDTVFRINTQNEVLVGSVANSPVDVGNYKLQVQGNVYIDDTLYIANPPKAATKDTVLAWQSGRVYAVPMPSGGGGGSTAWGGITGTLSDQTDLQSALDGKQDTLGFTAENVANKATDFSTVNNTLYPTVEAVDDYVASELSGYLPSATAASTYVSLSGSYSNPTWITALAWSKISGTPTTLSGYGIADAVPNTRTVNGSPLSSDVTITTITGNAGTATALQTGRTIDNVTFDGTANIKLNRVWQGKIAGETDTLTTGVKLTFRMPYACTITGVKAAVNTASSSGNITIDIHENGNTIMSTNKITIEASETTSLDATTQPTVTDTSIAADALMEVEVDAAGTNAISGEVTIYYTLQ